MGFDNALRAFHYEITKKNEITKLSKPACLACGFILYECLTKIRFSSNFELLVETLKTREKEGDYDYAD